MRVSSTLSGRHSETDFAEQLRILSDSGAGVIHVRTGEVVRATLATRRAVLADGNHCREWDIVSGVKEYDVTNMFKMNVTGSGNTDIHACMANPASHIAEAEKQGVYTYFVYINPQYWLEDNPVLLHHLQQYCHVLASTNIRVILITPDIALPEALNDSVVTLRFEPPSHSELLGYLEGVFDGVDENVIDVDPEDYERICYAGAGMSREAFEMYASLAIVESASMDEGEEEESLVDADDIVGGLNKGKTEVVNKNDILELNAPGSMDDVGGMDNLKEWVGKRADCYTDEAREFGIEPPKGIVFVGLPGTGKSLAAKAIANTLGVPLVRLDFGRVFNSLVGKSEERMRVALRMVESMAPCVLFCDEIDKGLGGIGGSGDSGTSSRVLGSFLTWLQETQAPVFTMVTANNITGLPPELLRRGRFDAIFSTGFPTQEESRAVLEIHLRKRGWDIKDFKRGDIQGVLNACRGYVPAELEAAVKDGLVDAFSDEEEFTMGHVVRALKAMVPLSVTYNEQIQAMAVWMEQNATPASKRYDESPENVDELRKRRIRTRPHGSDEDV